MKFHMWNFICEISHVKFHMWKIPCEISHVKHMWKVTCEISHVKHLNYAHVFHMWKITCVFGTSHVIHMCHFCKGESVQRTFTKRLPGLDQFTYADRLHHLKLQSVEHRRLLSDLILCFKIVRGFSSVTINDMFIPSTNLFLRGHSFRLQIPLAKCNIRKHSKPFFHMPSSPHLELTPWRSRISPHCTIIQSAYKKNRPL